MTHPYKDILIAIANGEKIQRQSMDGDWSDAGINPLFDIAKGNCPPSRYRIKPRTININGYEVPEPVREPLNIGETYWVAAIGAHSCCSHPWANDEMDRRWLKFGLIHRTEEAAAIHREALLSFTKAKENNDKLTQSR